MQLQTVQIQILKVKINVYSYLGPTFPKKCLGSDDRGPSVRGQFIRGHFTY